MKRVLHEALLVGAIGAVIAFAANALSPRRLDLTRDYFFQNLKTNQAAGQLATNLSVAAGQTNRLSDLQALALRLQQKGLRLAESNQVIALFHDPRRTGGQVIFVDARDSEHYQKGHIPGAYQFDYYHPADYLPVVLPACQAAQEIVVYCNGGSCEDSELAATLLAQTTPSEKFLVYVGGITEWRTNGLPLELGDRNSGNLAPPKP